MESFEGLLYSFLIQVLPCSSNSKESACNAGDPGSTAGLGRASGEGYGNPLQYSCLENPTERGAWQATQSVGLQRVEHDWVSSFSNHICLYVSKSTPTKEISNDVMVYSMNECVEQIKLITLVRVLPLLEHTEQMNQTQQNLYRFILNYYLVREKV